MRFDDAEVRWRKSSASGSENCVEVAFADHVAVRDSSNPHGALLGFSAYSWCSFLSELKAPGSGARSS
ncbi:DUF397 domain-containing protein [Streptomyces dioscori]|uniref:DUF397 domain-containing protein n=1 Tax=Streptomyces dioscori TaxID=2109333 RepID=A0A2P8PYU6_9ACTN|nr:DUF397 domain-containing protein [Streptomyces dioscori]PSM39169.1 DUF397 domain-containing protein [Streptomyces dioscori]